jgi:hypothetical protein
MKRWDELSATQRTAITVVVVVLALVAPELYLLVLIGGVDFAWLVLLSTFVPFVVNVRAAWDYLRASISALRISAARSLLAHPRIFAASAVAATVAFLLSGSAWIAFLSLAPIALSGGPA